MTSFAQSTTADDLKTPDRGAEAFAAAGGDARVFAAVYRLHYPEIHGYLRRRTGSQHLAEDLAAETFVAAWKSAHRFTSRGVPVRAWLMRIANNQANHWARRQKRRDMWRWLTARSELVSDPTPSDGESARVHRALMELSPEQQAVLCLHHVEGLSIEEAALVLGIAEGTVKSRLHRAREAFRSRLEAHSGGGAA